MKKTFLLFLAVMMATTLLASVQSLAFADDPTNMIKESAYTRSSSAPSSADILAASGNEIWFPQEESYFDGYTVMYVNAPKKLNAYVYIKPDSTSAKLPYAYQGSKVIVLAEEAGYYCILYTDDQNIRNAGWIKKDYLADAFRGEIYDIGGGSCLSDCINYGDAITSWSDEPFVGTKILYTKIDSLPSGLNECRGMTIEYKITSRGTNDNHNRVIYINKGDGWESYGTFSVDEALSPVRINLYFERPLSVKAVAVVPTNSNNHDFTFRQTVVDVLYDASSSPKENAASAASAEYTQPACADITKYGMSSRLTDAGDREQIMKRAQDIYDLYIDLESIPAAMKANLSVERLANVIRMFNGEFPVENGKTQYWGYTSLDEAASIFASYMNATSLESYGTNLEFKPSCVFFEEGSLAHIAAEKNDELLSAVYSDIILRDIDQFREDAVEWGIFVRDTFVFSDFTGDTIGIRNFAPEQQFPVSVIILSPYMPSIFEFALNTGLATSQGLMGDTLGICIPYGFDENKERTYIPLSEMLYKINNTPASTVESDPLTVETYHTTESWFRSKYDLEKR